MKANEAPEKIYFSGQQQWSNPFIGLMQRCADTDIEYTRTDAFIEKACSWLKAHSPFVNDDILDVWLDNFKKVMKGE